MCLLDHSGCSSSVGMYITNRISRQATVLQVVLNGGASRPAVAAWSTLLHVIGIPEPKPALGHRFWPSAAALQTLGFRTRTAAPPPKPVLLDGNQMGYAPVLASPTLNPTNVSAACHRSPRPSQSLPLVALFAKFKALGVIARAPSRGARIRPSCS